ncbi:MAG: hypothetical protein ACI396_00470 [Acutalibacteraceae bacterium]
MNNKEFTLTIDYSGIKKSLIYIDEKPFALCHGQNNFHLSKGAHHIRICPKNILNTKLWFLKTFLIPMYLTYPFGYTYEFGIDGLFPQLSFDLNIDKNVHTKISLVKCNDGFSITNSLRISFGYKIDCCNFNMKNLDFLPPLYKGYILKWRIVHGILPVALTVWYMVYIIFFLRSPNLNFEFICLHLFLIFELALMNRLAFFSKRKKR